MAFGKKVIYGKFFALLLSGNFAKEIK